MTATYFLRLSAKEEKKRKSSRPKTLDSSVEYPARQYPIPCCDVPTFRIRPDANSYSPPFLLKSGSMKSRADEGAAAEEDEEVVEVEGKTVS